MIGKSLCAMLAAFALTTAVVAQNPAAAAQLSADTPQADTPELAYVMELRVTLGQTFGVGRIAVGERLVIPITGGTFEGPDIKGEVLSGGADYQVVHKAEGRTDLEAIYNIRTDDGVTIHVRNRGIIAPGGYFYCSPTFEAPLDSRYAWLNNAIYVCRPSGFENGAIRLKVWMVRDAF